MYLYPNFGEVHKKISLYIDAAKEEPIASIEKSSLFFSEMRFRAFSKMIDKYGFLDLEDLDSDIIQDYNVEIIAYASQQTLEQFRKIKQTHDELNFHSEDLAWQYIQEGAGLILLNLYLQHGRSETSSPLFESLKLEQWLIHTIYDYDGPDGKDWKSIRCLFYRYLLYCGFVQVDDQCAIIKDSIPSLELLTQLADRLISITGMRESWKKTGLEQLVEETLNPENIAKHFLRFNGIIK